MSRRPHPFDSSLHLCSPSSFNRVWQPSHLCLCFYFFLRRTQIRWRGNLNFVLPSEAESCQPSCWSACSTGSSSPLSCLAKRCVQKSISHRGLLVCDRGFVCVCVCVMYDSVCQKFTSARLTGCVKMLLSQISDGFIAKSSDTTTIYPGSQIYSDKKKKKQ